MLEDQSPLSEREIEVLKLVATGATNQQIARELVISPNTVKVHLRNIFEKLGVQSRTEATVEAVRQGLVAVEVAAIPAAPSATDGGVVAPAPALAPEPLAASAPIAMWQRVYMGMAALVVLLAFVLPGWWQARSAARPLSALTDAGRTQVAPAVRAELARWTVRASLPEGRSRLALAAAGSKLYAIGGETAAGISGDVLVFDPASNGWLPGASKPLPVSNIGVALLEGKVYVPGGLMPLGRATGQIGPGALHSPPSLSTGLAQSPLVPPVTHNQVTSAVEVYDPTTDTWSSAPPLPAPRAGYALAALDNRLYLFGGWDGTRYCSDTFVFDLASGSWKTGTPMPEARAFLAAAGLKGMIFVVGGYDGQSELKTAAVYTPQNEGTPGGPWASIAQLNQARAGLGLVSLANRLYAIGGGWREALDFNEQYDMPTGAWSRSESPITEQWRNLGVAVLGEKIYAIGGWGGSYLTLNEEYQAIYRVLLPVGKGNVP